MNISSRESIVEKLASAEFDVLVIGGGVTGVGAALDAATRGLRVALIEANDFACGTSSRSSKLIHGGLRYLEQYDFKLVREALKERELMVGHTAPHLVSAVSFLFPLHEGVKERWYVGAGLALYDALRGKERILPAHRHVSPRKMREVAPALRSDILKGGILYYDAQVDDARHTVTIARTAERYGALVANQVEVIALIREGSRVVGVKVCDRESGQEFEIKSATTVLAAGIWNSKIQEAAGVNHGYDIAMSKGVHIVLPKSAISLKTGVILKTALSVLFVIPWKEFWIVGTTDTPWTGSKEEPLADRADLDYIIEQANQVLRNPLKLSDVISVYAGIRPLVAPTEASSTTKISREHVVDHPLEGLISVAGGKYTTYRIMARDAIDAAASDLLRIVPESCTEEIALLGADGYSALLNRVDALAVANSLSREVIMHLLSRYGSLFEEVLEPAKLDASLLERIDPNLPYLRAEIRYAVTHEKALHVSDVLMRRTRIALEVSDRGVAVARIVAQVMAPILGWESARSDREISEYDALVAREFASETVIGGAA
ncbi:MAG: glycerol-3-phosphate dehydrogenase [Actinobacteria bacterium]|nr:MAG: glycerol-3-phosphate dehydrogenase [Actinomycetota bacterium]